MSSYEGIIFDIDKTAVANGSLEVDPATVAAMKAVHESGAVAIAATGRALGFARPVIELLDLRHGAVVANGARVYFSDRDSSWEKIISGEALDQIAELASAGKHELLVPDDTRGNRDPSTYHLGSDGAWIVGVEAAVGDELCQAISSIDNLSAYPSQAWNKGGDFVDVNIGHIEAQKHLAVAHLLDEMGADPSRFIGVGDGVNDVGFISELGLKVATEDAHPDLLAIADVVVPPQSAGGFIVALELLAD